MGDKIYFISYGDGGYLIAIDRYFGREISKVKFSPPFYLNENTYGYKISGDPTNNILTISFGESTQIMGLKIVHP